MTSSVDFFTLNKLCTNKLMGLIGFIRITGMSHLKTDITLFLSLGGVMSACEREINANFLSCADLACWS